MYSQTISPHQIYLEAGQVHEVELEGKWEEGLFWRDTAVHNTSCVHVGIHLTGAVNKIKLRITALKVGLCGGGDAFGYVFV